jgi:hypothetical protein
MSRFATIIIIIVLASVIIINGVWIFVNPIYTSQPSPYMDVGSNCAPCTPCTPCAPCTTPDTRTPLVRQQQSTRNTKPTVPNTGGGNAFVKAINTAFSLKLGEQSSQDSCAAKHAVAEPVISVAHASFKAGDTCGGGRGEVWAGTPDPTMAARLWLNSPPHASIIRGASKLACGAGSASAVCVAY